MSSSASPSSPLHVVVLMPLRDDWASAAELILKLDQTLSSFPCALDILLVDDGSLQDCNPADFQSPYNAVRTIRTLRLRRNLGHQRAIAIGLVHIEQTMACDAVLVMDADGEDTPDGALRLIGAFSENNNNHVSKAIFAERTRRTETLLFRFSYQAYRFVHRILTGIRVRVGNFSILPSAHLGTLAVMSEMWNHYAAAFFRSGLPFTTIPIPRGYRLTGTSKMNFVTLAVHGISAISVFGDIVGVRLLIGSIASSIIAFLGIIAVVSIRLFTNRAIPGWATYASGTLAIICLQFITVVISFTFTMLSNRTNLTFVPLRDYSLFVAKIENIFHND
jgi:glycosyltransferase involved in cell wall biosynthesis